MAPQPLEGIRVLEIAHVMAGPVCGRMLADLGADVVKVERPGSGDPTRALAFPPPSPPQVGPRPGTGHPGVSGSSFGPAIAGENGETASPGPVDRGSAAFAMLNRTKRGVALDLKRESGAAALRRMLARCDVAIENFRPGTMERLGLGYESLRTANPRLVYCQITGFGRTGPLADRAAFDLIAQGMTGLMSITGEGPGRSPIKCGPPVADITAGILAAMGVLAALYDRERTGRGRLVDTSVYEAGILQTLWQSAAALATGESPGPMGSAHPLAAPYEAFPTKDEWITIGGWNQANWLRLIGAMDMRELAEDPRFSDNAARMRNIGALREAMRTRLAERTAAHWLQRMEAASVPAGPVLSIGDMLRHPQTAAREMVVAVPGGETVQRTIGMPVKLSGTRAAPACPAPGLGEHTADVLAEYGFTEAEIGAFGSCEADAGDD